MIEDDFTRDNGLLNLDRDSWDAVARQVVEEGRVDSMPDVSKALTFEALNIVYPPRKP